MWKLRCATMMNFLDTEPLHIWRISQQSFQSWQIRPVCEHFVSCFGTSGYGCHGFCAIVFHAL